MSRTAVVILAGTDGHENLGRAVNALETAKEFSAAGDDIEVIFDGAGTAWIPKLEDPDHDLHALYESVRESSVACEYCAGAFGVADAVADAGIVTRNENDGHPSIRSLVKDGYAVLTF